MSRTSSMKRYFKVFFRLIFARAGKELSLRLNLIFENIGSFIFFSLHLISFKIILDTFQFSGWTTNELWILMATFQIFTYLSFFLFWKGLTQTVEDIRSGALDSVIAKPVNTRFLSFLRSSGLHNFFAFLVGVILLIYFIVKFQVQLSFFQLIFYIISLVLSLWLLHCLSVIFVSLNFFFGYIPESSGTVYQFQESFKYPSSIYFSREFALKLIFIPLSLLVTFPTTWILSKFSISLLWWTVGVTVIVSLLSSWIWQKGLKSYSSASS